MVPFIESGASGEEHEPGLGESAKVHRMIDADDIGFLYWRLGNTFVW